MTLREQLEKLANVRSYPCVTISLNTHRTHPDNVQDGILLKNLCNEAEHRLLAEFDKRQALLFVERLKALPQKVDVNYNLESLHIFIGNGVEEIIRLPMPIAENGVYIANSFALRPLIKAVNRLTEYLILVVSQSGTHLYAAVNDAVSEEIHNGEFPYPPMTNQDTDREKLSDPKRVENLVREYLNGIDKALNRVYNQRGLRCAVVATEDNYSRLMQVADRRAIYYDGFVHINYNQLAPHKVAAETWKLVSQVQRQERTRAIEEMLESVKEGKVVTDVHEIYRAAKEGRGELLIVHDSFKLPARITGEYTFELAQDPTAPDVIDDLTSDIAWEVYSKKGRVIFTEQDAIRQLGDIALKVRY
ncbi:MAG: hypothetical protein NZM43_11260 [Saprospiraceae bacterium]|nr:hypothetical protein [Saprospiraceae bacterium]MDW8484886.1 hypothetical protein [Saprospiraceae bacterium]